MFFLVLFKGPVLKITAKPLETEENIGTSLKNTRKPYIISGKPLENLENLIKSLESPGKHRKTSAKTLEYLRKPLKKLQKLRKPSEKPLEHLHQNPRKPIEIPTESQNKTKPNQTPHAGPHCATPSKDTGGVVPGSFGAALRFIVKAKGRESDIVDVFFFFFFLNVFLVFF